MKKSTAIILALVLTLSMVLLPGCTTSAKATTWYVKYCEYWKIAKKSAKIKGDKLYLKGKWEKVSKRFDSAKEKKIR
ncbi:MAG: hypothetical protein IKF07_08990 [Eubacterium sp.]|nr:hypothetical protein [Eubacterium sp.]